VVDFARDLWPQGCARPPDMRYARRATVRLLPLRRRARAPNDIVPRRCVCRDPVRWSREGATLCCSTMLSMRPSWPVFLPPCLAFLLGALTAPGPPLYCQRCKGGTCRSGLRHVPAVPCDGIRMVHTSLVIKRYQYRYLLVQIGLRPNLSEK